MLLGKNLWSWSVNRIFITNIGCFWLLPVAYYYFWFCLWSLEKRWAFASSRLQSISTENDCIKAENDGIKAARRRSSVIYSAKWKSREKNRPIFLTLEGFTTSYTTILINLKVILASWISLTLIYPFFQVYFYFSSGIYMIILSRFDANSVHAADCRRGKAETS